jgi:hypothetical protein
LPFLRREYAYAAYGRQPPFPAFSNCFSFCYSFQGGLLMLFFVVTKTRKKIFFVIKALLLLLLLALLMPYFYGMAAEVAAFYRAEESAQNEYQEEYPGEPLRVNGEIWEMKSDYLENIAVMLQGE